MLPYRISLKVHSPPRTSTLCRGNFVVSDSTNCSEIEGIHGHIPGVVSYHVYEMVNDLRNKDIGLKLHQRSNIWPKVFQFVPPGLDDIGLFFFPSKEQRLKEKFIRLVNMMEIQGLAMKSCFKEVELLIFTPAQLPPGLVETGVAPDIFLWGVFRHTEKQKQKQKQMSIKIVDQGGAKSFQGSK